MSNAQKHVPTGQDPSESTDNDDPTTSKASADKASADKASADGVVDDGA